jgi:hypothetical protein
MNKLTRRSLLGAAAVIVLTGGFLSGRRFPPGLVESELNRVFGWDIATHPESKRFMQDFLAVVDAQLSQANARESLLTQLRLAVTGPTKVTQQRLLNTLSTRYVLSTNVVRHVEQGEPLQYYGLFDPYQTPCMNPLAARS